jgi:hypothetical protein
MAVSLYSFTVSIHNSRMCLMAPVSFFTSRMSFKDSWVSLHGSRVNPMAPVLVSVAAR